MKRLLIAAAIICMLFSLPAIAPQNIDTVNAAQPIRVVEVSKKAYCFDNGSMEEKTVRVHLDKDGKPDYAKLDGRCEVFSFDEEGPDGRYYQYYFRSGRNTWYFNM